MATPPANTRRLLSLLPGLIVALIAAVVYLLSTAGPLLKPEAPESPQQIDSGFNPTASPRPAVQGAGGRKHRKARFFRDEDGDGFNDNAPDHDGDGIPNGLDPDWPGGRRGKVKR